MFSLTVASGSHLESLRMLTEGVVDAAAIDSNVLIMERAQHPEHRTGLSVIESWGPFPIQPAVVRASLPDEIKSQIAAHLSDLHTSAAAATLDGIPFERFAPITYEDYVFLTGSTVAVRSPASRLAPSNSLSQSHKRTNVGLDPWADSQRADLITCRSSEGQRDRLRFLSKSKPRSVAAFEMDRWR